MNTPALDGLVPQWSVADRLRKARMTTGITTDEMAADIGRTARTITNYETGATSAPLLVLRQYALRTGVPLAWLEHGATDEGGPPIGAVTIGYRDEFELIAA